MTRRIIAVPACLLVIALVGAPSMAAHCNGNITAVPLGTETIYLDHRPDTWAYNVDVWLYLESNGVEGLQSGGDRLILEDYCGPVDLWCMVDQADPCGHPDPDTKIY